MGNYCTFKSFPAIYFDMYSFFLILFMLVAFFRMISHDCCVPAHPKTTSHHGTHSRSFSAFVLCQFTIFNVIIHVKNKYFEDNQNSICQQECYQGFAVWAVWAVREN